MKQIFEDDINFFKTKELDEHGLLKAKKTQLEKDVERFNKEKKETINNLPGNPAAWVADEGLWQKAKRASQHAFKEIRYPFVVWWYLQRGGTKKGKAKKAKGVK